MKLNKWVWRTNDGEKRREPNRTHVMWIGVCAGISRHQIILWNNSSSLIALSMPREADHFHTYLCVCIPVWLCQHWCITFELLWFQWLDMHEQQVDMTNNVLSSVFLHRWGVCPFFLFPCIRTCFRFLFSVFIPFMVSFSSIGAQLDWICVVHIVYVYVCDMVTRWSYD